MSLGLLSPTTKDLLQIFAHLDARSIASAVLAKAAERGFRYVERMYEVDLQPETIEQANILVQIFCSSQEWEPAKFDEMISTCLQYSLLRVATQNEERFYSMHVLVQNYLQRNTDQVRGHTLPGLITRLLGSAVTISRYEYDHFAYYRLLSPHIRLIDVENLIEPGDHHGLGIVLRQVGDGMMAITLLERCVEQWRRLIGEDHIHTHGAMTALGNCYSCVDREEMALEIREQALIISRRVWGDDSIETLVDMQNLAISYSIAEREQEALGLKESVLEKRRRLLGDEHRDTLDAMHNLAISYSAVGREQEVLELKETVLEKYRNLLGDEHRDTIHAMHNLAASYSTVGREQEAVNLQEIVLTKYRKLLGDEHRHTLNAMYNLACSYRKMGRVSKLEELLLVAIPLYEDVLGPDNIKTQWLYEDRTWIQFSAEEESM